MQDFLQELDSTFPELSYYKQGRIQTSPGVEEISDSPMEYYRTVGAIIALLACYSSVVEEDFGLECVSAGERGPMSMDKVSHGLNSLQGGCIGECSRGVLERSSLGEYSRVFRGVPGV